VREAGKMKESELPIPVGLAHDPGVARPLRKPPGGGAQPGATGSGSQVRRSGSGKQHYVRWMEGLGWGGDRSKRQDPSPPLSPRGSTVVPSASPGPTYWTVILLSGTSSESGRPLEAHDGAHASPGPWHEAGGAAGLGVVSWVGCA
jgi:hypothetical protein